MNHVTRTSFYRRVLLPRMLTRSHTQPETVIQQAIAMAPPNASQATFGTFLYGAVGAPPMITHLDAALRGLGYAGPVGELRNDVRVWLQALAERRKSDARMADEPFTCRETLFRSPEHITAMEMSKPYLAAVRETRAWSDTHMANQSLHRRAHSGARNSSSVAQSAPGSFA